jgi:glycosyltransferase involved in cell wall biosynthesis
LKANPRIVVGISALNEERTIAKVVIRASKYADAVLVVDDGSSDDTRLIAEKLGAVVRRHDRNLGKGAGLRACLDWARSIGAEVLVTLDADGQHDPDEIPMIIDPILNEKGDIVIGSRRMADSVPGYRRFGARVLARARAR